MNTPQIPVYAQWQRLYNAPHDPTSVWSSKAAAEEYADNYPTAYAGQMLTYQEGDEQILAVIQPDGTLKVAGVCNCDGNATAKDMKFIVPAGATSTVNVLDSEKHKAVSIDYLAGDTRIGTLRIAGDTFNEINVTGNISDIVFSRAGNAVSVQNRAATDIEVIFKFSYFNSF